MDAGAHGAGMISEIMSSRDSLAAATLCVDAVRDAARDHSVDHG
jgi:hypothetical protein